MSARPPALRSWWFPRAPVRCSRERMLPSLPVDSVAYFGETADGKTAFPTGIGAASGPVAGLGAGGFAAVVFGARVGAGAAAKAGAGVTATRPCRNDIRISSKARVEFLRRHRQQGIGPASDYLGHQAKR